MATDTFQLSKTAERETSPTALFDRIAARAVERYDFPGDIVRLLTFSENYTYLIENPETGNKDGVLRISRPGYHTQSQLESEMLWLRQINDYTPLLVANPLPAKDGSWIQSLSNKAGETFFCIVCEYLVGETPDEEDELSLVPQFEKLGETTAYLHRQTEIWNKSSKLDRIVWDYDTMIGSKPEWGRWEDFNGFSVNQQDELRQCCGVIRRRLKRYGKTPKNFGLIHADLRLSNLIVEGDQVKVIDFDDCGFGWHLHDLASAVSFIETKPFVSDLVNAWLRGYRSVLPFTDTDFEEIDTFIMLRRLQLTAWLASHASSDPVRELSRGWVEGTMELAKRYLRLFG